MAVALILIGLFVIISYEAQEVSSWLRQRVGELEIFLVDDADNQLAEALHQQAAATAGIEAAQFVSREEAVTIFQQEFGDESNAFLDEPFLQASIRVRVEPSYANGDSINNLIEHFESWDRVDEVVFNEALLLKVQQNLSLVSTFGLWLGALVILASIFLVANTVRLTIYARRLLIRTMKLVGANDAFIRRPFIVEGIVQGLLASVVAVGVLLVLYGAVARTLPTIAPQSGTTTALLVACMVVLGIGLGFVGSYLAVRRFIKHVALH